MKRKTAQKEAADSQPQRAEEVIAQLQAKLQEATQLLSSLQALVAQQAPAVEESSGKQQEEAPAASKKRSKKAPEPEEQQPEQKEQEEKEETPKRQRLSDIGDTGGRKPWKVVGICKDGSAIPVDQPKPVRRPNGLVYRDFAIGKGNPTKPGRTVKIVYEGMFPDGRIFDKNQSTKHPFSFRLGAGEVVRGMDTGVDGMRVGGCRELIIPSELGYGIEGANNGANSIPPNQTLIFRVRLLAVQGR